MAVAFPDDDIKGHGSAFIMVLDIYPQIMREMIANDWPPKCVSMQIENDGNNTFMTQLKPQEKKKISKLKSTGYNDLDVTCLYKLIRYFNLLPTPKQAWGYKPKDVDQSEGDDVERMRLLRNDIIHRPLGSLSESDRNCFFQQSIEIAKRMDKRNGSPQNGFESKINKLKSDSITSVDQKQYREALEECPKYRVKLHETPEGPGIVIYFGADIKIKLKAQKDQEKSGLKEVTVALIKPDAVKNGQVDHILGDIKDAGFEILRLEERNLSENEVRKQLYYQLQKQEDFEDLVRFMTSGPSYVLLLTKSNFGENVVEEFRNLIGPTNVEEAKTQKPESLRAKYGHKTFMNALHGSSSSDMATRELAFFFPDFVAPSVKRNSDKVQTTLALLRPKAFTLCKEDILSRIFELGFKVTMQKEMCLTIEEARKFYVLQQDQQLFDQFVTYMSSGRVLALGLSRKDAIEGWRSLLGPKEVLKAKEKAPDCLRAQFAVDDSINSLHGSDSEETAKKELRFFFPMEQTVAVIKPDAKKNKEEILDRIHEAGFRIAASKEIKLSDTIAKEIFADHKDKDYYSDLIIHMTSGPSYIMVLLREDAIEGWKSMIGPMDPTEAKHEFPDSIRAKYGESLLKNAVDGSSDLIHAQKTIKIVFGDKSSSLTIYLRDPNIDVNAVLQKIDEIKEKIRLEMFDIELKDIQLGSLKLHVSIPDRWFMAKKILHKNIQSFLHKFFLVASIPCEPGHIFAVVLAESDDLFEDNELTKRDELEYFNDKPLPVLKIQVNVKDSAFQNEFVLYREVNRFINGMFNSVDSHNVQRNGSAREIMLLADNESDEKFTSSSDAISDPLFRMAQDPVYVVSEAESNYFKISTLLMRIAPRAVRIKFDDVFKPEHLKDTLKFNSSKLADLKNHKCINQSQWNFMFPRKEDPTSKSFDTTLMICLFMNLEGIQVTNQHPTPTDFSIGADLSRIKIYRKDIAYSKDRTFTNAEFTSYWNETEAAVIRLSDGKVKGECFNLKTKIYDVVDRRNTHNLIHAGKRLVRIEELNEVADRVEKIDSKVAFNKNRELLENQIEEWEEETKWFVQTNAFKFILRNLDKRIFTVVGNPGMGKSMLLHQTALFLHKSKDYVIISCQSPVDIEGQFRNDTNQVFVLDDVCGQFTSVQSNVDQWNQYEIRIQRVVNSGKSVILASCRSQVFRESQCQNLSIFSGCLCDLNEGDCAIDYQQKLIIADKYLSQETITEVTLDLDSFDMFPLSCKLYKDREIGKSITLFHDPFQFYTKELDSFYNKDGGLKYFSLFLCVLHNGRLNQKILMDDFEFSQSLKIMFAILGLNQSISRQNILDGLDALLNMYLSKKDGQYNVLHDRLFDFLCYYFGQRYQQLIINHADSEIIRDRTLFKSLNANAQNFTILIDTAYEKEYIQRLVRDMLSGYIDDVLYNHQIQFKDFRYKLLSHLQEYDDDDETLPRVLSEFVLDEKEKTSQLLPVNFACKYGFSELFSFFLSKTKDVNAYEGNNITLITACRKGDKYMTGLLLEKGADVNQTDSLGCSPLLWSCVHGNLEFIQMLLDNEADIDNIEVRSNSSPLIWACLGEYIHLWYAKGMEEKVCTSTDFYEYDLNLKNVNEKFLNQKHFIGMILTILENGYAKGYTMSTENCLLGTTPRLESIMQNMMKILHSGDIRVKNDLKIQPLITDQTFQIIEKLNLFLDRGVDINKSSIGGITTLSFACCLNIVHSHSVTYLLSKGASVNICDIEGTFPLDIAIRFQNEDLVKTLIGGGAIVNRSVGGIFLLELAIINQNISYNDSLKKYAANFNELHEVDNYNLDDTSPIMTAIDAQDISLVDILIKKGADINKRYKTGITLLHYAIQYDNSDLISTLIKAGILLNCENDDGITPLMLALKDDCANIVEILVNEGAEVNTYNCHGMLPIMFAIISQNISLVDILIKHGADINKSIENGTGTTLLHFAINFDNPDLISTLIKAGIPVDCEDNQGVTPLMFAIDRGLANIVEALINEGAKVNNYNSHSMSPIMSAIYQQNISLVNILIKNGADMNKRYETGTTLLHFAVLHNNKDLLSTLIKAGIKVNCNNDYGLSPLMTAVERGLVDITTFLIKEGAEVDCSHFAGISPLVFASSKGDVDIVEMIYRAKQQFTMDETTNSVFSACKDNHKEVVSLLLQKGYDINIHESKNGNTCLLEASDRGLESMVSLLLEQGANVDASNCAEDTPLTVASLKGHTPIVRLLLVEGKADMYKSNKNGESSPILACLHNHLEVVKVLMDNGCNIDSIEMKTKQTCLSVASSKGFDKIVAYLIAHGANVNAQSNKGTTPLLLAASNGYLNIVKTLIEHTADVNIQSKKGSTCLSVASSKGFDNIVTYLLDQRANIDTANNTGDTPLMLASKNGHTLTVKILLENVAKVDIKNKEGLSALDLARKSNHSEIADILCKCIQSPGE